MTRLPEPSGQFCELGAWAGCPHPPPLPPDSLPVGLVGLPWYVFAAGLAFVLLWLALSIAEGRLDRRNVQVTPSAT